MLLAGQWKLLEQKGSFLWLRNFIPTSLRDGWLTFVKSKTCI